MAAFSVKSHVIKLLIGRLIDVLATAIHTITSDFKSTNDVGWYGSAYLLAQMSSQPVFGKIYTLFEPELTYLLSLLIFGVGSILCAAAPNSILLIVGRVVTRIAAAGLLTGSL